MGGRLAACFRCGLVGHSGIPSGMMPVLVALIEGGIRRALPLSRRHYGSRPLGSAAAAHFFLPILAAAAAACRSNPPMSSTPQA